VKITINDKEFYCYKSACTSNVIFIACNTLNNEDIQFFKNWQRERYDGADDDGDGKAILKKNHKDYRKDIRFVDGKKHGVFRSCWITTDNTINTIIISFDYKKIIDFKELKSISSIAIFDLDNITTEDKDKALEIIRRYKEQCSHVIRDYVENDCCPSQSFKEGKPKGQ